MNSTSVCGRSLLPATWILAAFLTAPATADTWSPPGTCAYFSADRSWRLTVIPRDIESPLAYFQDKVDGREPAGAVPADRREKARGVMEHWEKGQWRVVWDKPLLNEVSPVDAIVSSSGQAVTFDNWHSVGYGPDAVVIYDAQGKVVRALALDDFLPENYIRALPRSVSSIHWGGEHCMTADDKRVVLRVVVPSVQYRGDAKRQYVDVEVELASGRIIAPSGPAWVGALARAWMVNALSML
jgi:hypothetical protein